MKSGRNRRPRDSVPRTGDEPEGGLAVISRRALIEGGKNANPAMRSVRGDASQLIEFVTICREKMEMPRFKARKKHPALSEQGIDKLRA
ncbi:MAG: hypothetical protein O7F16_12860 [Acidobacteria bacterium]|nr:hypothetical protein [Acidobacteriota bacterium]